ncbi:hypothetical protein ACL6C3_05095 [Capilliphycus salinus ALCB114379]
MLRQLLLELREIIRFSRFKRRLSDVRKRRIERRQKPKQYLHETQP